MGIFNWLNKKAKVSNKARSSKNFEILRGSPEISVDIKKKIDLLSKKHKLFVQVDELDNVDNTYFYRGVAFTGVSYKQWPISEDRLIYLSEALNGKDHGKSYRFDWNGKFHSVVNYSKDKLKSKEDEHKSEEFIELMNKRLTSLSIIKEDPFNNISEGGLSIKEEIERLTTNEIREEKKNKVDKKLSIEKKVKCDDGAIRNYNGHMYGIIKCEDSPAKIDTKSIIAKRKMKRDLPFSPEIRNEKWFSEDGKLLTPELIISKAKTCQKSIYNYQSKYSGFTNWHPSPIVYYYLICINGLFFHLKGEWSTSSSFPTKLFSGTIDGIKCTNGKLDDSFQGFEVEVGLDKSFIENLPKSNVKFDDLDDKTKSEIEDKTIFTNEDGTIDQSKGAGKSLVERMNFFSTEIKGINIENIKWDFNNDNIPSNDIDGAWHFVNAYYLMKCISKNKFNNELAILLRENDIPKSSGIEKFDFGPSSRPTIVYKASEFTIEVPPINNEDYKMIVIFQNERIENDSRTEEFTGLKYDPVTSKMTLAANETLNYANELQDKGNHQEAIKFYKLILDLRQKNEYENIKVTDKLIMEFGIDQGAEIKKENIKVHAITVDSIFFNIGQSQFKCNNLLLAKEAYESAIEVNKDTEAAVFHMLGLTKIKMGDYTTCIKDFTQALNKDPKSYNSYYMRACAYANSESELNDNKLAKKDIKEYLKYYPSDQSSIKLLKVLENIAE